MPCLSMCKKENDFLYVYARIEIQIKFNNMKYTN